MGESSQTSDPHSLVGRLRANLSLSGGMGIVLLLTLVKLLLHLWANRGYGYFRDELYFLACGEHLDWGYVDQAPMVAGVAWLSRALFGDSLSAIRFFPAVAGAVKVLLAGLMARELGGGRFAQALAALTVIIAPVYFAADNFLSMNAFEPVFWMGCIYVLLRILNTGNPKLWPWFGVLAGLGLMNKHSMLFFGFALVVGLLLVPARKHFLNRWFWLAGLIAFLIFLPNVLWQGQNDWATLEFLNSVAASTKNIVLSPWLFFAQQILLIHPLNFPIWMAGLGFLFFTERGKPYRVLAWTYIVLLVSFIVLKGKAYYLAPAYPMLLAAGGVAVEILFRRWERVWPKAALLTVLTIGGAVLAPYGLPVLSPGGFLEYEKAVGIKSPRTETGHTAELPQLYADQFGWEEMTAAVARIYHNLSPEEKSQTAIFGNNYGEAGAIDFFGPKHGLPKAIGGHNNYYLWGPRDYSGEIMIVLGGTRERLEELFEQVTEEAVLDTPFAAPYENRPVYLCRGLKTSLKDLWPKIKNWI